MAKKPTRVPLHPGTILREEFMAEFGLSINGLARELRVPTMRISDIVNGRRGVTPDTAFRFSRYFETSPEFWLNLQSAHDLDVARPRLPEIERDIPTIRTSAAGRLVQVARPVGNGPKAVVAGAFKRRPRPKSSRRSRRQPA